MAVSAEAAATLAEPEPVAAQPESSAPAMAVVAAKLIRRE